MTKLNKLFKIMSGAVLTLSASSLLANGPVYADGGFYADGGYYNSPDCCFPCGENDNSFEFRAAYLYWRAFQQDLDFATSFIVPADSGSSSRTPSICSRRPDFRYNSGFRIGGTYNTCWCFDFNVDWTHFYNRTDKRRSRSSSSSNSSSSDNSVVVSSFRPLIGEDDSWSQQSAGGRWKLRLNYVDFGLTKQVLCSDCFKLDVVANLRWASIRQHLSTDMYGEMGDDLVPFSFRSGLRNNFDGIGPKIGLDFHWDIGWGLDFYTCGAWSILYGRQRNGHLDRFSDDNGSDSKGSCGRRDYMSHVVTDFGIGLGWDPDFLAECGWDVGIKLGWEHHLFFNMNNFQRNDFFSRDRRHGDLSMQGLTLAADIRF